MNIKQQLCSTRRLKLIKNATKEELIFSKLLDDLKIRYIFQKGFIKGDYFCIVDFYLPKPYKICIEIDGLYHLTEKQILKDKNKDNYLINYRGFKVIRFSNFQVNFMTKNILLSFLKEKEK
jgi:very-short-patch-repair endonuclease